MNWNDEDLAALHALECSVVDLWTRHPELTDHVAARAYEAAFQVHRATLRGHAPRPSGLSGLDARCHDAIQAACERLLTAGAQPLPGTLKGSTAPVTPAKLVDYLRALHRSVERHTKHSGRTGYLEFVQGFVA